MLGTANLFGLVDDAGSYEILHRALTAGWREFDTAPSYGFGRTEAVVGRLVAGRDDLRVTTKFGIEPVRAPSRGVRTAKTIARHLPPGVQHRLRVVTTDESRDRFAAAAARRSIERSLRRLGHIDRLLLHEVAPADLTDELLGELDRHRSAGDITELGLATAADLTGPCIDRAPDLLTTANVAVPRPGSGGPTDGSRPSGELFGHGVFGADGSRLRALRERLYADTDRAARWQAASSGTTWGGGDGLANALLTHAVDLGFDAVIVATSRPSRLAGVRDVVDHRLPLPDRLRDLVTALCTASTPTGVGAS